MVQRERPIGTAQERPIGAPRPTTAPTAGEEGKYGELTFGGHVPTTREIESGAVVVQEVQAVKDTDSVATADLLPLENAEEDLKVHLTVRCRCILMCSSARRHFCELSHFAGTLCRARL